MNTTRKLILDLTDNTSIKIPDDRDLLLVTQNFTDRRAIAARIREHIPGYVAIRYQIDLETDEELDAYIDNVAAEGEKELLELVYGTAASMWTPYSDIDMGQIDINYIIEKKTQYHLMSFAPTTDKNGTYKKRKRV